MRVSRDPLEPLRSWKELFFPEHREAKTKKPVRARRFEGNVSFTPAAAGAHGAAGD